MNDTSQGPDAEPVPILAVIAIICGTVYGGLFLLAHLLEPVPKETSIPVPGIKPRR